jgi:cytochrome b
MALNDAASPSAGPTRVWDRPTRIVHWLLVVAVAGCWWTAEHDQMQVHRQLGYLALGLLLFRLYWGFVGGSTARFSAFLKGPRAIFDYLRTLPKRTPSALIGHSPLGALSVAALIAALIVEVIAGLFSVDVDGIESGPFSFMVSFDQGRAAAQIHHLAFNALLGLIGLHLAAIAFYLIYKRDNLIGAMITGRRRLPSPVNEGLRAAPIGRLIGGVLVAALIVVLLARAS